METFKFTATHEEKFISNSTTTNTNRKYITIIETDDSRVDDMIKKNLSRLIYTGK